MKGTKFDADKARMDLLSNVALKELSKVLAFGASRYGEHNWRQGIETSRLLGAMLRHILAYQDGETLDPETGLSHIAHAMASAMFILELAVTRPDLDNRYINPAETQHHEHM